MAVQAIVAIVGVASEVTGAIVVVGGACCYW